jgi:hypothetical protein
MAAGFSFYLYAFSISFSYGFFFHPHLGRLLSYFFVFIRNPTRAMSEVLTEVIIKAAIL